MTRIEAAELYVTEVKRLRDALREIQAKQPARVAWFRENEIVFAGDGGYWEQIAFDIYTDLCEIESIARGVLDEAVPEVPS